MSWLDSWVAACLLPLALWILISGLDDLAVDLICLGDWLRRRPRRAPPVPLPEEHQLDQAREAPIAILIPLWREHRVIGSMIEHNLAAIHYRNYEFFLGAYPNDRETLAVVRRLEARFAHVHVAVCPHDGPTSKADCLNWVFRAALAYESELGWRFEILVVHDAEDVIHPEALRWINFYATDYDMVQIPVLPLPTPFLLFTHGLYCDEFAEFQTRDVPGRQITGSFIPSNGVGTGYTRRAVERLAASGPPFDPACLTEDYENGLRLHQFGCRQVFIPPQIRKGKLVATREYFPQELGRAVRQRTRWVMGIALQAWDRHGWGSGADDAYWLWRDRKGLFGNPASCLANCLSVYGAATWMESWMAGAPWGLAAAAAWPATPWLLAATACLQLERIAVRMGCVARFYGWRFALGVPMRIFLGNWVNLFATAAALHRYTAARRAGSAPAWLKTEHAYPSHGTLLGHKRPIEECLLGAGLLTPAELDQALASRPAEVPVTDWLLAGGYVSEKQFYELLSRQQNLPLCSLEPADVTSTLAHCLPGAIALRWRVVPFRAAEGVLYVAGPDVPSDEMREELCGYTRLTIRYHLIARSQFDRLFHELFAAEVTSPAAQKSRGAEAT